MVDTAGRVEKFRQKFGKNGVRSLKRQNSIRNLSGIRSVVERNKKIEKLLSFPGDLSNHPV